MSIGCIFNAAWATSSRSTPGGDGVTIKRRRDGHRRSSATGRFVRRPRHRRARADARTRTSANKGYVDQLIQPAPILIGVIDAGTGNCSFADGIGRSGPGATGSRHYIICTRPGTIPGGPAAGIVMRLGDELFDGEVAGVPRWILIAVGTGGVLTTADQVALIPNVAGTNNVQAGMQVLNTNKVEKAGDYADGDVALADHRNERAAECDRNEWWRAGAYLRCRWRAGHGHRCRTQ